MADTKKSKRPPKIKGTSPVGVFAWPKINKPDFGNEDYPKPAGEFSVVLVMDKDTPEFSAFVEKYQPMHDKAVAKAKTLFKDLKPETRKKLEKKGGVTVNDLYTELLDENTEEPTGKVKIKFAMTASGERKSDGTKWFARPAAFDAKGQPIPLFFKAPGKPHDGKPIPSAPQIWNGTQGRVAFAVGVHDDGTPGYFISGTGAAGLKLGLEAVKVLVLKSGGDRDASSYGFDGEDEGYAFDGDTAPSGDFGAEGDTGVPDEAGGDTPDNGDF